MQKYLNLTGHVIVPVLVMVNKKAHDAMGEDVRRYRKGETLEPEVRGVV